MNVYYLGPEGSYHHIVAKHVYGDSFYKHIPQATFTDIINKVKSESDSIGVLALENSSTSDVHENIDSIFNSNLAVVGEANLLIKMNLIGLKGAKLEDIKRVHSHPKALAQCSKFLRDHDIEAIEASSTSEGCQIILEKADKANAGIGSKELANNPELELIAENIDNQKYNITRFVFVSQEANKISSENNKLTFNFKIKHEPGSLAKVLTEIAKLQVNLTKIESRPIPGTDWEYNFWVDIDTDADGSKLEEIINVVKDNTLEYKVVGVYRKGQIFDS